MHRSAKHTSKTYRRDAHANKEAEQLADRAAHAEQNAEERVAGDAPCSDAPRSGMWKNRSNAVRHPIFVLFGQLLFPSAWGVAGNLCFDPSCSVVLPATYHCTSKLSRPNKKHDFGESLTSRRISDFGNTMESPVLMTMRLALASPSESASWFQIVLSLVSARMPKCLTPHSAHSPAPLAGQACFRPFLGPTHGLCAHWGFLRRPAFPPLGPLGASCLCHDNQYCYDPALCLPLLCYMLFPRLLSCV